MNSRFQFLLSSFKERLWVKPTGYAVAAIALVLGARIADGFALAEIVPDISRDTIDALVTVMSSSMLGVATFAVASMVAAYASASRTATPRVFVLLIKDGASQRALSCFVGAFIFSIVSIIALRTEYYGPSGRFVFFLLSIGVVIWVVATFVRWVDNIARLGRIRDTVSKIEDVAQKALGLWGGGRALGCTPVDSLPDPDSGEALLPTRVGYVQHVDVDDLQRLAQELGATIAIACPPGTLASPVDPLAIIQWDDGPPSSYEEEPLRRAFTLADTRTFEQDPRLGLIAMSEIASRALSPAENDPGSAIEIIARVTKVFFQWKRDTLDRPAERDCDRVTMAPMSIEELFDDAFGGAARDGAATVEVGIRLQKSLAILAESGNADFLRAARQQSRLALARSEQAITFEPDLDRIRQAAAWSEGAPAEADTDAPSVSPDSAN